ncbi:hypothetical protein KP509_06G030600 [Ceratopteris richardii]|nr:hypothetical protein KP509_06G030600 [Ceratopteris richardii]
MDPSGSGMMISSLDSSIPEPEFLPSSPTVESYEDNEFLCSGTPELSQSFPSAHDVEELVEAVLSDADGETRNTSDVLELETPAEWFDCVMYDNDENVASCLGPNTCESTESSEPIGTSIDYLPCTSLDALPDAFTLMEEASKLCSSSWTEGSAHEIDSCMPKQKLPYEDPPPSCDVLDTCPRELMGLVTASPNVASKRLPSREVVTFHAKRSRSSEGRNPNVVTAEPCRMSPSLMNNCDRKRVQNQSSQVSNQGVKLMQLLLECAKAIENDRQKAETLIPQLKAQATRYGDPIQRLASYFTDALSKRLARAQGRGEVDHAKCECSAQELTLAYKAMNEACPYFTFAQLTANQAILEAIQGADRVHIVDFGISQGVQWAAMLQAIATQEGQKLPSQITITGVASPELRKNGESLAATGHRLSEFAQHFDLNLEFRQAPVALDDPMLSSNMFHIQDGEVVIVNFMLELCHLLDGAANEAVPHILNVAAKLSPCIVTLSEMDAPLNVGPFQKRFVSALYFFSAMFDSLEAGMNRDSMHRLCMERWFLGEYIHTMVGGHDNGPRRRWQTHAEWRKALEGAGFELQPLSNYAISQARILLLPFCESFTLNEQQGSLSLGWQHRPLLNVSAWTVKG